MIHSWFEDFWQTLIAYKIKQRIPSGLMLCGLPGIGKTGLTQHYAQYILCQHNNTQPCQHCRSCQLYKAGTHPDLKILQPEEPGGTIKIGQVRELVEQLVHTPNLSEYQVAIINKAEDLNRSAANALLKNLEEPHGQVLLLLISEQPQAVPATIRSRCQMLKLPVPSKAQAMDYVTAQLPDAQKAQALLAMTDYLPLKALEYSAHVELRDSLIVALEQVQQKIADPTITASQYLSQPITTIEILITLIVDMIRIHFSSTENLNHCDKAKQLTQVAKIKTLPQLCKFQEILIDALRALKNKNNANLQLLMEKIFIRWLAT